VAAMMKFSDDDVEAIGHCLRHIISRNDWALGNNREHLVFLDLLAHQLCKDRLQRIIKRIDKNAASTASASASTEPHS